MIGKSNISKAQKDQKEINVPMEDCEDVVAASENIERLIKRIADIITTISSFSKRESVELEPTTIEEVVNYF